MKVGIYKISSKKNPKRFYIGSTSNFKRRHLEHFKRLRKSEHHSIILQRHVDKYGLDDLEFSILEICHEHLLLEREQYYIDSLNPYFNVSKVAGRTKGVKQSDETKQKRAEKIKQTWANKSEDELNAFRLIQQSHRIKQLESVNGQHGFILAQLTDKRDKSKKALYDCTCLLCDRTFESTRQIILSGIKCKCMKITNGCEVINRNINKHLKKLNTPRKDRPVRTQSGERYIYWQPDKGTYKVMITISQNKKIYGGYHNTIEQAIEARDILLQLTSVNKS